MTRRYQRLPAESGVERQPPLPGLLQLRVTSPLLLSTIVKVPPPRVERESTEMLNVF